MAGSVAGQIETSLLSCSICMEHFKKPKALPCLHTFCEDCLRDYIVSRFESVGSFPCPICRQLVYIPPNGVYGFPDNHFIISLQDTVQHSSEFVESGSFDSNHLQKSEHVSVPLIQPDKYSVRFTKPKSTRLLRTFGHFGLDQDGLVHVSGMAFSPLTGEILVADCSLNKVLMYSKSGDYHGGFVCDCSIRDIAVTAQGSILLTVSRAGSAIMREYGHEGNVIASHGSFYKFENPFGICISRMGKVIISSLQHSNIHIFTERKKPSTKFGSRGSGPNHFMVPYYVAVNSRDDIVVSDSGNHRVKIHKNDGTILHIFGKQGSQNGEFFYPQGVFVDKYDNIYVADANNFRVQVFSPEGEYLSTPVENTYEFGVDVKPTNVIIVENSLVVALRGTRVSLLQIYDWSNSDFAMIAKKKKQTSTNLLGSCCPCLSSQKINYDEI
ncbi:tripartite motif-containing protein 2-like [Saccostrea echinata]|uniref:tripartite motif-containing protein 2-like n=1 Tax=Saccostrea echinata TaxID=191078 RepID=UPI002A82E092|nr:tripartite motif-containing protein 2-like [Saccostrea echinata]